MKHFSLLLSGIFVCMAVIAIGATQGNRISPPQINVPLPENPITVTVDRIIDGDTIVVYREEEKITVRLIGVDTPETVHPNKPVERFGKESSAFLTNLLQGEEVYLVADPQQGATDKYGRTLAYVLRSPDRLFVNAEIIRQGYGHAYPNYPFIYLEQFRQLESFARQSKKGLWNDTEVATQPSSVTTPLPLPVPIKAKKTEEKNPEKDDPTVYVTKTGAKYHSAGCSYLKKSAIPMKLSQAKSSYGPCSRCNPPK